MDCICKLMHIKNTCISVCSRYMINGIYLLLYRGKFIIITAKSSFIWLLIPCTCNSNPLVFCAGFNLKTLPPSLSITWVSILQTFQVPERQNSYLHCFSCPVPPDFQTRSGLWVLAMKEAGPLSAAFDCYHENLTFF